MTMIDVDFEVFKELTVRRRSEAMSENDVIREALGLKQPAGRPTPSTPVDVSGIPWVSKGVSFPNGTEFRATYKGQLHRAIVKNGALEMNGRRYSSPSAAAVAITGNAVNGWRFWECLQPGTAKWRLLADLRR